MAKLNYRKISIVLAMVLVLIVALLGGAIADRLFGIKPLDYLFPRNEQNFRVGVEQKVLREESVVIDVAERVGPSVVTVAVKTPQRSVLEFNLFGGFSRRTQEEQVRDIGSGFLVSEDGLVVTNKHVVSSTEAEYKVIDRDGNEYDVTEISRDPSNDLAVIKINASGLNPVELGTSQDLKVGQFVIAIGTALGEFRHTVTTGVVSGLGRGITAGSVFEGYVEKLDDVIQTDAAINPGNSGGPLLNSAGQVIGVNVAVAQGAENIGFAIPVDVLKEALNTFTETGSFASKPFLGVQHQLINRQTAILNEVPQGAYVVAVVEGSPAEAAGIEADDIITKLDGEVINEENPLADVIAGKSAGQNVSVEVWRDGETLAFTATLSKSEE